MRNIHKSEYGGHELVLLRPRVTEKSSRASEGGVYVFLIAKEAGKRDVKNAIKALYNVSPLSVNIVRTRGKTRMIRGKVGHRQETKKAYVTLAKGTTIDLA